MSTTAGLYLSGAACVGVVVANLTYGDMLRRARRKRDTRLMSLHHMIHHDKEFNVLGVHVPSKWFGGAVALDQHRKYIVATKSLAYDYTVVATGSPCLHCGFLSMDNATDIVFSDSPNMQGLDFPDANRQTFLLHDAWMANEDLKSAQLAYFKDNAGERPQRTGGSASQPE